METMPPEQIVPQVAALLERSRTSQARTLLKGALLLHPEHNDLLLQSAVTDFLDEHYEESTRTVRQVLATVPTHAGARQLYFQLLIQQNSYAQAEHVILELLRDYPEAADYYGKYGHLMLRTMNLTKARQLALAGLKYDCDDDECLAVRTISEFIEQRTSETSHGLQQLLVKHPESAQTLLLVVVALEARGDFRGALQIAQQLLRAHPDDEALVEAARTLSVQAHWSMLPLWPMQRWGWAASFVFWIGSVLLLNVLRQVDATLASSFAIVVLVYVVYSWTWPGILKRLK